MAAITFPLWFQIFLGWIILIMFTGTFRRLSRNKTLQAIRKLPTEKLDKLNQGYLSVLRIERNIIFALPVIYTFVFYLLYVSRSDEFLHIIIVGGIGYVFILEDFFYRRSILKRIKVDDGM
jgi:hypothetical protein